MKKILNILAKLTFLRVIASFVGLMYSIFVVRTFGASSEVDSYFIAVSVITVINKLLQGGQLSEIFLPIYIDIKNDESFQEAQKVFFSIVQRMVLFVLFFVMLLIILAPYIINVIGAGLSEEQKYLAINIFRYSTPIILFSIIASLINTVLNAEKIYGRAELTTFFSGVFSILLVYSFADKIGIYALLLALLNGKILEFILGVLFLKKAGFKYYLNGTKNKLNLKRIFNAYRFTSVYVGFTQIFELLINFSASFLPVGTISLYNYANQLSTKAFTILSGPFSNIFFTEFKHKISKQRIDLKTYLITPLTLIFIVFFFSATTILLFGDNILELLWSKKNISNEEHKLAHVMLTLNFIGMVFTSFSIIFRKGVISIGKARDLYYTWSAAQIASAIYTYYMVGVYGSLGLATISIFNMLSISLITLVVSAFNDFPVLKLFSAIFLKKKMLLYGLIHLFIVSVLFQYDFDNLFYLIIIYLFFSFGMFLHYLKYFFTFE